MQRQQPKQASLSKAPNAKPGSGTKRLSKTSDYSMTGKPSKTTKTPSKFKQVSSSKAKPSKVKSLGSVSKQQSLTPSKPKKASLSKSPKAKPGSGRSSIGAGRKRKDGATVFKKADGSKTIYKKGKDGAKVTKEKNAKGKVTSTTRRKFDSSGGYKSVTKKASGTKISNRSDSKGGNIKRTTKKDGSFTKVRTLKNGKRVITKGDGKGNRTVTKKGVKKNTFGAITMRKSGSSSSRSSIKSMGARKPTSKTKK